MLLPPIIQNKWSQLEALCEQFLVNRLYVFGSVLTDRFDWENSDLDFLVEMKEMSPLDRGENLLDFWEALELLFNRPIDLLTDQPIANPYLAASILQTKQLIYDGASEEVLG